MKLPDPLTKLAFTLAMACLLAVGCTRDKQASSTGADQPTLVAPADGAQPEWQNDERTWVGLLPCRDCQGIDTRLVLRSREGRRDYLLTETYLGGGGRNTFTREGAWTQVTEPGQGESRTLYVLDPDQAGQRFSLQPDGALELLEGNGVSDAQTIAYRLQRL